MKHQDLHQDLHQDRLCKRPRHEQDRPQEHAPLATPSETKDSHAHLQDTQDTHDDSVNEESDLPKECHDSETDLEDDDIVLSEVHIHPDNGRVDGRIMTSTFALSTVNQNTIKDASNKDEDNDKDDGEPSWDLELHIQHAMGTNLRNVGSQVWMGCFLLVDYMVELGSLLDGCVALELGAGTGISSIASGILTNVRKMFCTDFDTNVLSNCQSNVNINSIRPGNTIVTRRLNWFLPCPMEVEGEDEDDYSWTLEEMQEWTDEGAFIFAADVVYDDSLTDALVECLERLLTVPLPAGHPRHEHGRVAYMTMEKRYNFSLNELDVVAQAHDYFVQRMGRSTQLHLTRLDTGSIGRHCDYERTKDLELFQIACRLSLDEHNTGTEQQN
ncbi:hypothetical protein MVEG_07988 [Podila verticillata NRRL 6337]|nr:hypothetical protein MVEG_07988 [Podila verticillata NRRL 6337]